MIYLHTQHTYFAYISPTQLELLYHPLRNAQNVNSMATGSMTLVAVGETGDVIGVEGAMIQVITVRLNYIVPLAIRRDMVAMIAIVQNI